MVGVAVVKSRRDHPDWPEAKLTFKLVLLTTLAVVGGFLFGYDTGVISGANLYLKIQFNLDDTQQELVVSVTVAAAALFSLVGGFMNEYFGRKKTIIVSSLIFVIGSVILAASYWYSMLLVGRFLVGVAIGISSTTIPLYIAETSPTHFRGRMITMFQLLITFGLFMSSVIDAAFSYITNNDINWRLMLAFAAIPAAVQFFGFMFMPESPRWLATHGKEAEAFKVLVEVNGGGADAEKIAKYELEDIKVSFDETQAAKKAAGGEWAIVTMFKTPHILKALAIGCLIQMFQQLSGINTVMYYSASIIQMGGISSKTLAIWMAAVTSGVNFVCTFLGIYLVDRIGRRLLLLGSVVGVTLTLLLLGIAFDVISVNSPSANTDFTEINTKPYNDSCASVSSCDACSYQTGCGFCFDPSNQTYTGSCVAIYNDSNNTLTTAASQWANYGRCSAFDVAHGNETIVDPQSQWDYGYCPTNFSWLPILGMVLYLCSFSAGYGPMPWAICAEIFPNWARSSGVAICTAVNWLFNLVISLTFLTLAQAITREGAYFLYAGITFLGFIIFLLVVPETKDKELEEIEELLKGPFISCGRTPKSKQAAKYYNSMDIEAEQKKADGLYKNVDLK